MTLASVSTVFAGAEEAPPGLNPAEISQVNLANQLITLGDARKDPLLLLAAAQLQKTLSPEAAAPSADSHGTSDVLARAKDYAVEVDLDEL